MAPMTPKDDLSSRHSDTALRKKKMLMLRPPLEQDAQITLPRWRKPVRALFPFNVPASSHTLSPLKSQTWKQ